MRKQLFNIKKTVLILAAGLMSMTAVAQLQVGNSDFETWDAFGTPDVKPQNWNSFMNASGSLTWAAGEQINRSSDAHTGTYSARIWSRSAAFGIIANGNMTLGKINMGSATPSGSSNYNMTKRGDAGFNQPFTGKPDSLVVWVKYTPITSTDEARISATIHDDYDYRDPENAAATPHAVARAILNYGTTNNAWKRISIPFDYSGAATVPAYILITFTTNKTPGGGKALDEVLIDDLEMIYNDNEVKIAPIAEQTLFVNQSGAVLTATETPNAASTVTSRQWKSATTLGGPYTAIAGQTAATYTPNFTTAATYYVVCETDFDGDVVTSNEVKVVVNPFTIAIAPTAVQNLVETQTGNTLTVTENTVANSREWKFSATSGSGYTSFTTAVTGTTYTPQFATAGTYYVVCESTLFGSTVTSNEVQINVTESISNLVSIYPTSIQTLIENQSGTTLSVSETPSAADSREWKFSATSGSGYASFATAETGATYTPVFANEGTYYVVCVSDFAGEIVTSGEVQIDVVEFTNSIDPSADQTMGEAASGALLTVTETPVADSREWKFSTTSGSGYTSFTTPETGTTYTPVFADEGTYYVICESKINTTATVSNEVTFVVTSTVGLNKNEMPTFAVYASDQVLNIDFSQVEMNNASIRVMSVEGKEVVKSGLVSNQMNSIQLSVPTGVYFFSISNGEQSYQGKVFIKN